MRAKVGRAARRLLVPSYSDWLFAALLVWLFVSGEGWSVLLADGDTGWHIRTGEFILDSGRVPRVDLFSFSKAGAPWFAWEWLADALFGGLWRAAGLKGVVLLTGIVLTATLVIVFRHMLWRGANLFVALGLCLLVSGASGIHYLARPHIFTLLLAAVSMWIIDWDRRRGGRVVWLLVPLAALWANLHGGFVVLVASLGVLAGAAALGRRPAEAKRYGILCGATAAASLLNPYGIGLHLHMAEYLRSDWIRQAVDEFQSPKFRSESALHFEILLFAGILAAGSMVRRRDFGDAALILVWAHAALVSVRHVPVYALIAAPGIAAEATRLWKAWVEGKPARSWPVLFDGIAADFGAGARRTSVLPAGLIVALLLGGNLWKWPHDFPAEKFPSAIVNRHPELAGSRVFTSDQWGDYLIYRFYPRQRVFMDGRSDFYGPQIGKLYLSVAYGHAGWRKALDRYSFAMVLAEKDWPLASLLRDEPGWAVLDEDGRAVLFRRTGRFPIRAKETSGSSRNTLQEPVTDDYPRQARLAPSSLDQIESRGGAFGRTAP